MLEILKITMNWGFPAFFCILFYIDFRRKINSLDKVIRNDLVHTINKLDTSINKLIDKI